MAHLEVVEPISMPNVYIGYLFSVIKFPCAFAAPHCMKALRMGIYMHQHRLPRKGRGAGICYDFYCECGAFTVNPYTDVIMLCCPYAYSK